MKKTVILLSTAVLLFLSCSDGLFQTEPVLDNQWDPENPEYSIPEVPTDGLLAEYLFSGNTDDTSGNGHDCTGTPGTFVADRLENTSAALAFDGSSNYLIIPDTSLGKFSINGNTTISLWFKSTVENGTLLGHSTYYDMYGWKLYTSSYGSYLEFASDNYSSEEYFGSAENVTDGNWHHIILMNTGFTITFYVDGTLKDYDSFDTNDIDYGTTDRLYFFIGARRFNHESDSDTIGRFFTGVLDDIRIYDRNLTGDEIFALFMEDQLE